MPPASKHSSTGAPGAAPRFLTFPMARRGAANARRSPGAGRALSRKGREEIVTTRRDGGRGDDQEEHEEKDEQDEEQHDGHDRGDD